MRQITCLFFLLNCAISALAQQFEAGTTSRFFADTFINRHSLLIDANHQASLQILKGSIVNNPNAFFQLKENHYQIKSSLFDQFGGNANGFAAADIDLDGDLDIFQNSIFGQKNILFINKGNGIFEKSFKHENICQENNAFHASFADVDADGDPDLLITNSSIWNPKANAVFPKLYLNNGKGDFQESATNLDNHLANTRGAAWSDVDNDGDLDLLLLNFGSASALYENKGLGNFEWHTSISNDSSSTSLAADFADLDNDGFQDLMIIHADYSVSIFKNKGHFDFQSIANNLSKQEMLNGAIHLLDLNNDGAVDIYSHSIIGNEHQVAYQKSLQGNFIKFKLRQEGLNFYAIGAKIALKSQGVWQFKELQTKNGLPANNTYDVHFGVANASIVDSLKVLWTDGRISSYRFLKTNESYLLSPNLSPELIPANFSLTNEPEVLHDLAIQIHADSMKLGNTYSVSIAYQNKGMLSQDISIELETNAYSKLLNAYPKVNKINTQGLIWKINAVPAKSEGRVVVSLFFENNVKSILTPQFLKARIYPIATDEDKSSNMAMIEQEIIWNPTK
jgi:hypothetical protein